MGYRVWGTCMDNEVQGYGHKGMGHMGNRVQGYGAHGQWGTGVWDT